MLPPVNASIAAQPVTAPAIGQREARPDGPTAVAQGQAAPQQSAAPATRQGSASETLTSLRQLADFLASRQVDADDILTRLAIDFAAALGETPLPDETPRDFANRLAGLIRQLPAATLLAARQASNLGALNIQPQAFAAALADPASPAAARIVAMAEDPGADGLRQMLKTAIASYEQNSTPAPATIAAQKSAATATTGSPGRPVDPAAVAEPVEAPDAETSATAPRDASRAAAPQTAPSPRPVPPGPVGAGVEMPAQAAARPAAPAGEAKAEPVATRPQGHSMEGDEGQPTMQVLRGFNVVVANVATRAADVLKTVAALAQQAETSQIFAPAGKAVADGARVATHPALPVEPDPAVDPVPVITDRAHQAARAMEGRVVPLFSHPASAEDIETVDIDHLIRIAQQTATKADPARLPELALAAAQARLPEPVPFAQIPYPFLREEEEKRHRRGFGEQSGREGEEEEMAGENGQSLWHGDGEPAERRDEPEIEEHPFDAEEPLKRNPTDAERALHMYQRFGGF